MNNFFSGFEKQAEANGLVGTMPNLAAGNKAYSGPGQIAAPKPPKPGIVQAPRSDMPPMSTLKKHDPKHNLSPVLPRPAAPNVAVPKAKRKGL